MTDYIFKYSTPKNWFWDITAIAKNILLAARIDCVITCYSFQEERDTDRSEVYFQVTSHYGDEELLHLLRSTLTRVEEVEILDFYRWHDGR